MAAKPAQETKSLVKREPTLVVSGVVTLLSTALYVLPTIAPGLKIPDSAQKLIAVGLQAASAFGIRSLVKPA